MVRVNPDPYLVLGVSPTATQAEITHAYRDRLRAHHPDTRHTPPPHAADEQLQQLLVPGEIHHGHTAAAEHALDEIAAGCERLLQSFSSPCFFLCLPLCSPLS